ncbi:hypothetical protein LQG66_03860 [Bradyrhizobium ontarionense]|uniref:Uncharacterized protein n=1 Tax=Bradyrhizobium ontarionense TaxID=2898149 RepID=A0ABY3RED3_9BRAD|nr:hypothetical protein [Bradyrhizobium sp. A19]UFZ05462.1 hypothetical protein LQG66_03860 [Bradyrhizobium sp. A19]
MSYSFGVWAKSKAEAKAAVAAKLDEVIATQAIHARDKSAILANAAAVIDLLGDAVPDGHEIHVGCNGSVSWIEDGSNVADIPLRSGSISASATYHRPLT